MSSTGCAPIPSATVVMLREGGGPQVQPDALADGSSSAGPEVLLVRRSTRLRFHGGAWVFPGGRIDPDDACPGDGSELAAARQAAVREVREEVGLELAAGELRPLSCWTTPEGFPRRFRTWFFVARLEHPDVEVQVDGEEIRDHRWLTPETAVAACEAGELELPPPTLVTLLSVGAFSDSRALLAACQARPPERFLPRVCETPEGRCYLYEGDAGYNDLVPHRTGPRHRLWLRQGRYVYEKDV